MSLITRCPTCQTQFRVVPDQLRISDGWVRCGQCQEIFDASLHLLAPSPPVPMPPVPPEDQGASVAVSDATFLHKNKSQVFWRRPLIRAALVLLSLALLLGLAGQVLWHERDRIAALEPGLKPWLLMFCKPLGCTLSPLQGIESIVIDSASFGRLPGDTYRLNFTLKNTSAVALAVPAIELTLTDLSDQPLVRRVYRASELGVRTDTLAGGSESPLSLTLTVTLAELTDRVVGYRLLAFYP
jgi:predicted Zn finger-like uncharacterized protein